VAILEGQENNTFWQRQPEPDWPDKIVPIGTRILVPGDVISFMPEAIHSIQAVGDQPLVTFNLYGETHSNHRFEFDPIAHTAKNY
jgi:predicted metal-dependent enzyme (double-stranded beta helix superfamily)